MTVSFTYLIYFGSSCRICETIGDLRQYDRINIVNLNTSKFNTPQTTLSIPRVQKAKIYCTDVVFTSSNNVLHLGVPARTA